MQLLHCCTVLYAQAGAASAFANMLLLRGSAADGPVSQQVVPLSPAYGWAVASILSGATALTALHLHNHVLPEDAVVALAKVGGWGNATMPCRHAMPYTARGSGFPVVQGSRALLVGCGWDPEAGAEVLLCALVAGACTAGLAWVALGR